MTNEIEEMRKHIAELEARELALKTQLTESIGAKLALQADVERLRDVSEKFSYEVTFAINRLLIFIPDTASPKELEHNKNLHELCLRHSDFIEQAKLHSAKPTSTDTKRHELKEEAVKAAVEMCDCYDGNFISPEEMALMESVEALKQYEESQK